jgi:Na+-transporting methylmalonyl-CoA/oxaloacetate decarboxylase gamma subunit
MEYNMKNTLVILTLALASMSAFAGTKVHKEERKAALESCKTEGKTKKELKSCVKEKLNHAKEAVAAPAATK